MPSFTGTELTPEELVREGFKLLSTDRARLGGVNYAPYRGETISPMSTLTQRARGLRNKFASNPRPYSAKIQNVLQRPGQGITQQNIQDLINNLNQGQTAFGQNAILPLINRNVLSSYGAGRGAGLTAKTQRDINDYIPEFSGNLGSLSRISNNLEQSRNAQIVKALQGLQGNKEARREALVGNLEQFGKQRHAYNNMQSRVTQNQFNQEFNEPHRKMGLLEEALLPYKGVGEGQQIHPDLEQSTKSQILQALKTYGIDTSKPSSEWSSQSNRLTSPGYQGQLIADLPAEITASGDILERLKSNLGDENTARRRAVTQELVGNQNISDQALQNLPQAIRGRIGQLEKQGKDWIKKQIAGINNKYIQANQHGSPQHLKEVEKAARQLNQSMTEQRAAEMQKALADQLQAGHADEINKIREVGRLGEQSHSDYANLLKNIRGMNELGAEKFKNNQGENERLYHNFQNERLWEWPHMRGAIRREGIAEGNLTGLAEGRRLGASEARDEIFGGLATRGLNLDQLARLNTDYNELNKTNTTLRQDLTSMQQAHNALQQQLNAQRAEEQRKINAEQQRVYAAQQAERQRKAAEELQRLGGVEGRQKLEQQYHNAQSTLGSVYEAWKQGGERLFNPAKAAQFRRIFEQSLDQYRDAANRLGWKMGFDVTSLP